MTHGNAEDACKAVQADELFKARYGHAAARPFNQYAPQATTWWLLPEVANPAFPLGKFGFDPTPAGLFVGLHVEKGLGAEEARTQFSKAKATRLTMDRDWLWPDILHAMRSGALAAACSKVADVQPCLRIVGGHAMQVDPEAPSKPRADSMRFSMDGQQLACSHREIHSKALGKIDTSANFNDLADHLEGISNAGWVWINLWLGAEFILNGADPDAWSARHLWLNALQPFSAWFR